PRTGAQSQKNRGRPRKWFGQSDSYCSEIRPDRQKCRFLCVIICLVITIVLLGTAQDGGVPHLGCRQPRCERARRDPTLARRVTSLGIIDSEAQKAYLVDATP